MRTPDRGDRGELSARPIVLRSKLTPPALADDVVERPLLADSVRTAAESLTMIVAPGGSGKTTLLAEVVERVDRVAWIHVDAADNDAVRFWSHVLAAVAQVGVRVDVEVAALARDATTAAVDALISALEADGAGGDDLLIVLDDAHELVDADVIAGCARLVSHAPTGLRLVVSTRTDLTWPIPRLLVNGDVRVIDADDLALRGDGGRRLFDDELRASVVDAATIDELVDRVDGWPAGLRFAKLALQAGGPSVLVGAIDGGSPDIARYLADEVLAGRDADEREFLVATSVLSWLTPEACDAVRQRSDSLSILRRLVADRVFTSRVPTPEPMFAYHRVLHDYLRSRLDELSEDEVDALHRRAIDHYRAVGNVAGVIDHAVRSGDVPLALDTLADTYIETANAGRIAELWRWVEQIGPEHVIAHPVVGPMPAWASLNLGRYEEIDPWLEAFAMVGEVTDEQWAVFAAHAATIRCHRDRHLGALDASVEQGRVALDAITRCPDDIIIGSAHAAAGAALVLAGDGAAAVESLRAAIDASADSDERSSLVFAHGFLALQLLDDGDEQGAQTHAQLGLDLIDTDDMETFNRPAVPWLVIGRLAVGGGRVGDARAAFDRAAHHASAGDDPLIGVLVSLASARLHHLVGDDEHCRAELRSAARVLDESSGVEALAAQLRAAQAATRFAPTDTSHVRGSGPDLSVREVAVVRLLVHDLSRRELAAQLFVSENTVKTHLTSIRRKLGVTDRADIVARARELGLLDRSGG